MKIQAIIVEDEPLSRQSLVNIINKFCSDKVELICECDNVRDSVRMIKEKNPDLVFLDIKLGDADNGAFEILQALPVKDFHVIFTTGEKNVEKVLAAHKEKSTISYLLKPLDIDEVISSVEKVQERLKQDDLATMREQIDHLMKVVKSIYHSPLERKIEIPIRSGVEFIALKDIIMFKSDRNNCLIFVKGKGVVESTRNFKYFATQIDLNQFFLASKQYMVNLSLVEKYSRIDGKTIYLEEKCQASLSSDKKEDFFQAWRAIQKSTPIIF